MWLKMASNLLCAKDDLEFLVPHPNILNTRIIGIYCHTWFSQCCGWNPVVQLVVYSINGATVPTIHVYVLFI